MKPLSTIFLIAAIIIHNGVIAKDIKINEFRKSGGGLVCIAETDIRTDPPYLSCLRVGTIYVGQKVNNVEKLLGEPWKVIPRDKNNIIKVYPIDVKAEVKPYWVITYNSGKVDAIQLTGEQSPKNLAFSSIRIGDKKKKILAILGKPTSTKQVKEIGGEMWIYRPFPISIEIKAGKVYSIRVSRKYS